MKNMNLTQYERIESDIKKVLEKYGVKYEIFFHQTWMEIKFL